MNKVNNPLSPVLAQHVSAEVSIRGWTKEENEKLIKLVQDQRKKWIDISPFFPNKTVEQCINHWFNELMPKAATVKWTKEEDEKLTKLVQQHLKSNWAEIAKGIPGRKPEHCRTHWRQILEKKLQEKEKIIEEENNTDRPNKRPRIELPVPFHGSSQRQENSSSNNLPVQGVLESSLRLYELAIAHLQEIQLTHPHPLMQSVQSEVAQHLANVQLTYQEIKQKLTTEEDCSSIIKQAWSLTNSSPINTHHIEIVYQHFIWYQTDQEHKEWFSSQSREFLNFYLAFLKRKIDQGSFFYFMSSKEKDYDYDRLNHLSIRYKNSLIKYDTHFNSNYKTFIEELFFNIELELSSSKYIEKNWKLTVSSLETTFSRLQEIEVFFQSFSNTVPSNEMESHIIDRIKNKITLEDFYKKQASLIDTQEGRRTEDTIPLHESSQIQEGEGISLTYSPLLRSDEDFSGPFAEFLWTQENLSSNDPLASSSDPEDNPFLGLFKDNPSQEF